MTQNHFQASGDSHFKMIDISQKMPTFRRAIATGKITVGEAVVNMIREKKLPKGDVISISEIAGIMAAKNTSQWLPLCHPLNLSSVKVSISMESDSLLVRSEVSCESKTGVEMEALVSVSASLLCIYDLVKMVEPNLLISAVKLVSKQGGKSGNWSTSI